MRDYSCKAYRLIAISFLLLLLSNCTSNPTATEPAPGSPTPTTVAVENTPTTEPTETPAPALSSGLASLLPTAVSSVEPPPEPAVCALNWCIAPGHFWFARPIPDSGETNVERTYRFGTTQEGAREVHHGVEFNNPRGTPVLAAADGSVVVAGNDKQDLYADHPGIYGNLVILEHHFAEMGEPIYTLYAHLDEVLVKTGDTVKTGDVIGKVGASGAAIGSHLHFEVRQNGMTYQNSVNPELWLKQDDGMGAIAASGKADEFADQPYPSVKIEALDGQFSPGIIYVETYQDINLQRDPEIKEFFAVGNLPAGHYRVTFSRRGIPLPIEVEVQAGQLTHIIYPTTTGE